MTRTATAIVRQALSGSGVDLVASCGIDRYDARAPEPLRSASWLSGARGVIVAASAGPALWRNFLRRVRADGSVWDEPHPYDAFVAEILDRADDALRREGVRLHRFDAAFHAKVRVDFVALGQLVGLGLPGPFGLLIHAEHGPWWALRGAWLVDAEVEDTVGRPSPCVGCAAPCVDGLDRAAGFVLATAEVRGRCVVGSASRYDDDQIAYHYDRARTVARLKSGT